MIERAVSLSIIEIVLGSIFHTLHIPFSGHLLSLNQSLFLADITKNSSNRFTAFKGILELSNIVAIMKSISPSGKKIGPMISISMQGFLFAFPILCFGRSLLAQFLGMLCLSIWAFIQPLVTFFLIYGVDILSGLKFYKEKLGVSDESFFRFIGFIYLIKIFIGGILLLILYFYGDKFFQKYHQQLQRIKIVKKDKKRTPPLKGALKDLIRPSMIVSYLLMGAYFFFYKNELSFTLIMTLRSIAIAFIIFFILRTPLTGELLFKLANKNKYFLSLYKKAEEVGRKVRSELEN